MKNMKGKAYNKVVAFVACMVFGCILTLGGLSTILCYAAGYYQDKGAKEIRNNFFEKAYRTDAVMALASGEENQFNSKRFTNFQYAVLEGEHFSEGQLEDSNNYIASNFTKGLPDDYMTETYTVGEKSNYFIAESYFGNSWIEDGHVKETQKVDQLLLGISERTDEGDPIYASANVYAQVGTECYYLEGAYYIGNATFNIGGVDYSANELKIIDDEQICVYYSGVDVKVAEDKSEVYVAVMVPEKDLKTYTIICSCKDTITKGDDFLYEANHYYKLSKSLSTLGPAGIVIGLLGFIGFFAFLMTLSGYHTECVGSSKEIYQAKKVGENLYLQRRGLDKIPMDLNLVLMLTIIGIVLALGASVLNSFGVHVATFFFMAACVIGLIGIAGFAMLLYFMSVASNFKCPMWWHNTLIYSFYCFIIRKKNILRNNLKDGSSNLKMHTRIWLIFGLLCVLEWLGLMGLSDSYHIGFGIVCWIVEKAVLAYLLGKLLGQFARIKETTKKISEGDLSAAVDTKGMFLDLEAEGDYINTIRVGLDVAIAQRMKSEHFQTELITNVSHDIKTPLTSIINYVDLLGKEEIKNEKAKEYLEVLQRQSLRLKKLLQDLLDASKATTGSVELHMEKMDVSVLLNQIMGEFEEKLKENGMELKAKVPENIPPINADSQYLWRVLDNLMTNVCKYGQPATRAYLNLEVKDKNVEISFLNTSKEELNISAEELMQRFVRGDSSRNTEGSGLGLSIAQSLTQLMGGKLNLSIDGDLFKVVVTFPICSL